MGKLVFNIYTLSFVRLRVTYYRHFTFGSFLYRGSILFELGAEGTVEACWWKD